MSDEFLSLSFVTPVYRGEAHLEALVARQEAFRAHLGELGVPLKLVEAIFVCDEPVDGSAKLLDALAAERPWITVLHMAKNLGQHAATAAGMLHASGDWVATMDEDGQHDPFKVLDLARPTLERSLDICYATPQGAVHPAWWRNASSRWTKKLVASLVDDPYVKVFNSFRLVRGEIARAAGALASHDLYLDVALRWFTDRVGNVAVEMHDPRASTRDSGYTFRSLLAHMRRLLTSYHVRLLNFVTFGGFLTAVVFGLLGVSMVLIKVFAPERIAVPGWTSTYLTMAFFGGLTLFLLGLCLDRLSITLTRAQGRPAFFIVDRSRDRLWYAAPTLAANQKKSA